VIKTLLKILMILIMLFGLALSILNFLSVENQAIGPKVPEGQVEGTRIVLPDGSIDCQGAPSNC
jgi:hypothetical protein